MQNDLTKLLGIEYPIIQGGMMMISGPKLTAAVSEAGGLGTLGQYMDTEKWHEAISSTREMTSKPFAVNMPLHTPDLEKKIQIIIDEKVPVAVTAAGSPKNIVGPLKEAGLIVMHVVASARQAEKVAALGVDAVIAEGGESGGMVAKDRVSTMVLIPAVDDVVDVPIVAAGGIADARGFVAALALGAQGVQIGTRFIVTPECDAVQEWKDGIINACDTDTTVVPRGSAQGRMIKENVVSGVMAGIVCGLIKKIETTKDIIDEMHSGAKPILESIERQL